MSTPQITITPAGFAAIVNAENTGTAPVKITQVGLTAQHFDVATVGAAVPNEAKRLTTFGGKAIADDTLHLNVRDDGQDTYTLRGFGLYLDGGTLFAVYSQAAPIMEKAAAATLLLAADIRFTNIAATSIEVGDVDFINPPASTTQPGVVRLATEQEADAGSDHSTALTPRGLAGYINRRFGAGAPSAFVKGLLSAATAAIFRVELGLKSAATRDEGHGNGLNADLLDGEHGDYYLDWKNFKGVPSSFPPNPHSHAIENITGLKAALDGKQPAGNYAAAIHQHDISQVADLQNALSSKLGIGGGVLDGPLAFNGYRTIQMSGGNSIGAVWGDYPTMGDGFHIGYNYFTTPANGGIFPVPGGLTSRLSLRYGGIEFATGSAMQAPVLRLLIGLSEITHYLPMNYGSSLKLKDQHPHEVMPYGLKEIEAVELFAGRYNDDFAPGGRRRLFTSAESLREIIPEAVMVGTIEYRGELVDGLDDSQLVMVLIQAVKELSTMVRHQGKEISALKACH